MLGLAAQLPPRFATTFIAFPESGRCRPFLDAARQQGHDTIALASDSPHIWRVQVELCDALRQSDAAVLCCHGYKADLLGRGAARRVGIPVVAVSRGWTGETRKVRFYEML